MYLPALSAPPLARMWEIECREVNRLVHFLGIVLPSRAFVDLAAHGAWRLRSVEAATAVAGGCAAALMLKAADEQAVRLRGAVEGDGVLADSAEDVFLPSGWDSMPMVYVVERGRAVAPRSGARGGVGGVLALAMFGRVSRS